MGEDSRAAEQWAEPSKRPSPRPESLQEDQYVFPYHHLPHRGAGGEWRIHRSLDWGYEYLAILEAVCEEIVRRRARSVLDIGCGDGRLLAELGHLGLRTLVGTDTSPRALDYGRGFLAHRSVVLSKDVSSVCETFDVVTLIEVLEHVEPSGVDPLLAHARRLLAADGRLIVSVPTLRQPLSAKHYRHFSLESLSAIVGGRLEVERVRYVHRVGPIARVLRWATVNRFVIVQSRAWLSMMTALYRHFVRDAGSNDGAHMIAVLRAMR